MAEITRGIRAILNHPLVYELFQVLVGANRSRKVLTRQYIQPEPGMRVLDIGCGPADLLAVLPPVDYLGFDLSPQYIESAQRRFGSRGRFYCERFDQHTEVAAEPFDRILAVGLLHHLDDEPARHLFHTAHGLLKPEGRLITMDCCFSPDQSRLARALISRDRGQNVRRPEEYRALAESAFGRVTAHLRHDMLNIPYSHTILECRL